MAKFLIFAGTTEGRQLIENLLALPSGLEPDPEAGLDLQIIASVATQYGRDVLEESVAGMELGQEQGTKPDNLTILSGRLSQQEMTELMKSHSFDAVVDATHPYATVVTDCIRTACGETETAYIRLLREDRSRIFAESGISNEEMAVRSENDGGAAVFVESVQEAARYLSGTTGPVLLTTGSKELRAFTEIENYQERLFARVLPMAEVVQKCTDLGFSGRQLICMQGPFSYEMNAVMMKQTGARYLVTKDSGKTGGFDEKLRAAEDLGVCPVIIGRKPEAGGKNQEQVLAQLSAICNLPLLAHSATAAMENSDGRCDWFPLFTNIKGCNISVIGAGTIAARRIRTLLQFSCKLTVIAPEASETVREAADQGRLTLIEKTYETADIAGEDYVLAATDDRACNHRIYCDCRERGVPVNVADCKEESDFYFPGLARCGDVVAGFTACGKNHSLVKEVSKRVRKVLEDLNENS